MDFESKNAFFFGGGGGGEEVLGSTTYAGWSERAIEDMSH